MTYLLSSTASRYVFMPVRLGVCGGFTVYWAVSYNTRTKCVPITKAAICFFFFFFQERAPFILFYDINQHFSAES